MTVCPHNKIKDVEGNGTRSHSKRVNGRRRWFIEECKKFFKLN